MKSSTKRIHHLCLRFHMKMEAKIMNSFRLTFHLFDLKIFKNLY
jgi:hypothetical protein